MQDLKEAPEKSGGINPKVFNETHLFSSQRVNDYLLVDWG